MGRIADLRKRVRGIPLGTIWVCQCCALSHANGECCADDQHGGDGIQPWALWDERFHITAGRVRSEHGDGCDPDDPDTCWCEFGDFHQMACEGCGSTLAGSRYAHTLWREPQRFRSGFRIGMLTFEMITKARAERPEYFRPITFR